MESISSVHILALNDDCFLELFKYLSIEDLCSIKQTNLRLWNLVEFYFQLFYLHKENEVRLINLNGRTLRDVFEHCGKFMRKLIIKSPHNYSDLNDLSVGRSDVGEFNANENTYICHLIGKYCSDILQQLQLTSVFLSGLVSIDLSHVLPNLHTIEMNKCGGDADQLMKYCPNIRTIIQRDCAFFLTFDRNYLLDNEYRHLERLIIYNDNQTDLVPEVLIVFFEMQRTNLKCLHYINRYAPTPTQVLPTIIRAAKDLNELCIELETFSTAFTSDLRCLLGLSNLKRLEFNTDEIPVTTFINELAALKYGRDSGGECGGLECVGISDVYLDETLCQAFMKFTSLKLLKLIASLRAFDDFFTILSQRMDQLEQLYLVQCSEIHFSDLMVVIENCPKLNTIYLYESPYVDWSADDYFEQFSIDFVHLFKIRSGMSGAAIIDWYLDARMLRLIEEHVWPHVYEWFTKNGILRLKLADDDFVNGLPGYCPKIDHRF